MVDSPAPSGAAPQTVTIETTGLGDRSYLVHDGSVAVVVDPQRDIDRVLSAAASAGLHITHVVETHIHNDYLTGGLALARACGAAYLVPGGEDVGFERIAVSDRDRFSAGRLTVTALHTPGHTPHHFSYLVAGDGGAPAAVFTGGSMLFGAVGRTDLVGPEHTDALTRAQYRSVRRLAAELADGVAVHPTHGFGSFCSAAATSGEASTIGEQRRHNVALLAGDEDTFVKELVGGLTAYPRYYAHMAPANRLGPDGADLGPVREIDPAELRRRVEAGEWVVDLRRRRAFARRHVTGTVSVELGDSFVTFLGWTMPWGTPLNLIGDSREAVADAQRQLSRIGIDQVGGAATGAVASLADGRLSRYEVADFAALARRWGEAGLAVLDVRRPDEWEAGHLDGAGHIPFWELEARMAEVPSDREVWVHCASGFRASIAASLADRAGRRVVHVDDEWVMADEVGLPIVV